MTTPARPGQFTGATDNEANGGLFTDSKIDGIPDLVAADVASAQTSATNAAASATTATTQATTATTKATEASTSATAAANSATAAATSATNAASSATTASNAVSTVTTNATNAATSETNAATSATNAAASASTASTQATNATTQANSALSSASAAATSATNAANSFDSFDDRYLGAKSSDPSTDNDGDALATGALYFKTGDGMQVYTGSAWDDVKPTSSEQTNINTVAAANSNIAAVAGNATNINAVGAISANVTSVANIASDVTSLANSLEKTYTVTVTNPGSGNVFVLGSDGNAPAIEMFRGNTYVFNQSDATNDGHPLVFKNGSSAYEIGVTYFLNGSEATQSNYVNASTFNAGRATGVRKVQIEVASNAPSSGLRYYCYVHGNAMGNTITVKDSNISLVAGSITNVNTVGAAISNVNAVAGNATNINTVAGNNSNITSVAGNETNINAAVSNASNINSAVSNASNITAVAGNNTNINTVAGNNTNINTVAGISSDVTSVAGIASNVTTVANNVSGVNSFADRYRVASSAPTGSLDIGDLYFDTTANELKVYKSSGWAAAGSTVNGTSARFTYNISGTPTTVSGADANGNTLGYDAGFIDVYLNGVKQVNGTDVTVTSGNSVVFASALANGDVVDIVGFGTFNVAAIDAANLSSGTINIARLGSSGTKDNTTFLRGDNTFAVVDTTNASNLSTGTLPNARLSSVPNSALANSAITINGSSVALGGSVTLQEDFVWEIKTSAFNAAASRGYFVDTASAAVTATLPSSATLGDTIRFVDHTGSFDNNNLTIARNGHKIQGATSDMTVATERAGLALVYVNAAQGWVLQEK
tara:strand:+ start:72 stop:2564 length:2493 start_codon:yes stop_codon:yes gene_type:complete